MIRRTRIFVLCLLMSGKMRFAYETYAGNQLTKAAICGTGFGYGGSTIVSYPQGSTCIKAVAWDGTRTLVYDIPHE
mgnify:CR=1 FL=1